MSHPDDFDAQAESLQVFGTLDTLLGIPSTSAIAAGALGLFLGFGVAWWLGLLVGLVGLFGLYQLHQLDPLGPKPWAARLQSGWGAWRIGRRVQKSLLFID